MAPLGMALALALLLRPRPASTSWSASPFASYGPDGGKESGGVGVRRFSHSEERRLEDGSELALGWSVHVDPDTVLSLDTERRKGVRLLRCHVDRLVLLLPAHQAAAVQAWRYVVASRHLHGCGHIEGEHLYHRVLRVESVEESPRPPVLLGGAAAATSAARRPLVATLVTRELASASEVLPYTDFSFRYVPAEAGDLDLGRSPRPSRRPAPPSSGSRRLSGVVGKEAGGGGGDQGDEPKPPESGPNPVDEQSIFNYIPREVSSFGWNWDFEANSSKNPEFKIKFPSGQGYAHFIEPIARFHAGLTLNFTSHIDGINSPPHVRVVAVVRGHGYVGGDMAVVVDIDGSPVDAFRDHVIPLLQQHDETTHMSPLEFYIGSVPICISLGFRLGLRAYQVGQFRGAVRVGISASFLHETTLSFDSAFGLRTNFSTKMLDARFWPPRWLFDTKHVELGAMLEPELFFKGSFGGIRDADVSLKLQPYLNISVMSDNASDGMLRRLAVYPFRAIGTPVNEEFAVRVIANGMNATTSRQISFGAVDYFDPVLDFVFPPITEDELLDHEITVSLLRGGVDPAVASATVVCAGLMNGECTPSPVQAQMRVDDRTVIVLLTILLEDEPLIPLLSKTRSISIELPSVKLTDAMAQKLALPDAALGSATIGSSEVELRLTRDGRNYDALAIANLSNSSTAPVAKDADSNTTNAGSNTTNTLDIVLSTNTTYEFGTCFLDSWRTHYLQVDDPDILKLGTPTLELLVGGKVVGTSNLPPIPWDQIGALSHRRSHWEVYGDEVDDSMDKSMFGYVPVTAALYDPTDSGLLVGFGTLQVRVQDPARAAFWIWPCQAEQIPDNQTDVSVRWTAGAKPGEVLNFSIAVHKVKPDGSYSEPHESRLLTQACTAEDAAKVRRFTPEYAADCAFNQTLSLKGSMARLRIAFSLNWTSAGAHHRMISSPIDIVKAAPSPARLRARRLGEEGVAAGAAAGQDSAVPDVAARILADTEQEEAAVEAQAIADVMGALVQPSNTTPNSTVDMSMGRVSAANIDKSESLSSQAFIGSMAPSEESTTAGAAIEELVTAPPESTTASVVSTALLGESTTTGAAIKELTVAPPESTTASVGSTALLEESTTVGALIEELTTTALAETTTAFVGSTALPAESMTAGAAVQELTTGAPATEGNYSIDETVDVFPGKWNELQPRECPESPLVYKIGGGVLIRTVIHRMHLPKNLVVMGDASATQEYDSGWQPLTDTEIARSMGGLLPDSICAGGFCEGLIPACDKDKVSRVDIPGLTFELSRSFPWTNTTLSSISRAISYGLGVLPEAIDLVVHRQGRYDKEEQEVASSATPLPSPSGWHTWSEWTQAPAGASGIWGGKNFSHVAHSDEPYVQPPQEVGAFGEDENVGEMDEQALVGSTAPSEESTTAGAPMDVSTTAAPPETITTLVASTAPPEESTTAVAAIDEATTTATLETSMEDAGTGEATGEAPEDAGTGAETGAGDDEVPRKEEEEQQVQDEESDEMEEEAEGAEQEEDASISDLGAGGGGGGGGLEPVLAPTPAQERRLTLEHADRQRPPALLATGATAAAACAAACAAYFAYARLAAQTAHGQRCVAFNSLGTVA